MIASIILIESFPNAWNLGVCRMPTERLQTSHIQFVHIELFALLLPSFGVLWLRNCPYPGSWSLLLSTPKQFPSDARSFSDFSQLIHLILTGNSKSTWGRTGPAFSHGSWRMFSFFTLKKIKKKTSYLYWGITDEQCGDGFRWTMKGLSQTYVSIFSQTSIRREFEEHFYKRYTCWTLSVPSLDLDIQAWVTWLWTLVSG